jgi:glycosyltransferase involved in cell wall biosynthesis
MRVLYITNSIGMGGASVALINLLKVLVKHGIKPLVTCPAEGPFSKAVKDLDINVQIIGNQLEIYPYLYSWRAYIKYPYSLFRMLLHKYSAYKKLCSCIETFHPDIIHTNVGPIHIGYLAAKKYKIPHIWHIREYQKEDFGMRPFPSMHIFLKRIHDNNNHCICITKNIFEHFKLTLFKDKVIYDGVINKQDAPIFNENKKPYIFFAGRLQDAKGVKDLLYAYNQYALNNGIYDLYIAGNGSEKYISECMDIIDSKIKNKIFFLGECQHEAVYKYMYEASVFVVPSRNEGFGFITAEAMFNGTIVIGKDTGGTKEQFDNGKNMMKENIAFRYRDLHDLTSLLFQCQNLQNYTYKIMAIKAQQVVCKLYDIENQANKVHAFYHSILQS